MSAPTSLRYVPSAIWVSASENALTGTISYYPSSAGETVANQKDFSVQLHLSSSSGSIFCYVQATNDTSASPIWVDITPMAYSYSTNTGSYSSLSCATGTADWLFSIENINAEKWRVKTLIDYSNVNHVSIYKRSKILF